MTLQLGITLLFGYHPFIWVSRTGTVVNLKGKVFIVSMFELPFEIACQPISKISSAEKLVYMALFNYRKHQNHKVNWAYIGAEIGMSEYRFMRALRNMIEKGLVEVSFVKNEYVVCFPDWLDEYMNVFRAEVTVEDDADEHDIDDAVHKHVLNHKKYKELCNEEL